MIRLKDGVKLDGLSPQILLAIVVADQQRAALGWMAPRMETVVTSVNDSQHRVNSLHYQGRAVDLRTHDLDDRHKDVWVDYIRRALGKDFDVLLEGLGTPNEHLHLEWDPKP